MYFKIRELKNSLQSYKKILIYGTGVYAKEIYPVLCEMEWRDKIECFVVTETKKQTLFFDKEVRQADEIQKSVEDRCVLVAVNSSLEDEIAAVIKKQELGSYILLSKYLIDSDDYHALEKRYKGKTFGQYIEYMAEAYEYQHIDEMLKKSRAEIAHQIRKNITHKEKDEKQIVIVAAHCTNRCKYIFRAMADRGYRITILDYCKYNLERVREVMYQQGMETIPCWSVEDLLYRALQFDPLAYYVFPKWSDASIATIMIQQKEQFGKIALELYDVMNGCYNVDQKLWDIERYALENADGVVWRYFAKEYLEKEYGFHYHGKALQFVDCCAGDELKRAEEDNTVLKLCMAFGDTEGLCRNRNDYKRWEDGYLRTVTAQEMMENITDRADVWVHVYLGNASEEDKAVLREVEENYSNFKVYYNTPYGELKKKLMYYDYGLQNYSGKDLFSDDKYRQEGCTYLRGTYIMSMAQKCFDYIDAGMAVISKVQQMLCDYLEQYGVLIRMDADRLDVEYLKQHKREYRRNAEKARITLSIENHIDELLTFFGQL